MGYALIGVRIHSFIHVVLSPFFSFPVSSLRDLPKSFNYPFLREWLTYLLWRGFVGRPFSFHSFYGRFFLVKQFGLDDLLIIVAMVREN